MKIRIATAEKPLTTVLVTVRSLECAIKTMHGPHCVRCVAVGTRAIRRGDVIIPYCPLDCSGQTPFFDAVVADWIAQRRKRAVWENEARERDAHARRTVRQALAA